MNNNNNNNTADFSLHDYLHTIGKRIFIIIESVVLIVFFVMLFSYYQTPVFEAKGRIMIEKDDFTMTDDTRRIYRYDDSILNYIEILKSTVVTKQLETQIRSFFTVVLNMNNYNDFKNVYLQYLPQNYSFILSIHNNQEKLNIFFRDEFHRIRTSVTPEDIEKLGIFDINVSPVAGTEILNVSVKYNNPVLCEYISNHLFEIFSEKIQEGKNEEFIKKIEFIDNQMKVTLARIKDFEEKIENMKVPGKIYNIAEDIEKIEGEIRELRLKKEELLIEKGKYDISTRQIRSKLENRDYPQEYLNTVIDEYKSMFFAELKKSLVSLEIEHINYMELYGDKHPKVVSIRNQIKVLTENITEELQNRGVTRKEDNPFYVELLNALVENSVKLDVINADIISTEKMLNQKENDYKMFPPKIQEYNLLKRELNIAEKTYNMLLENLNSIKIKESSVKTKVKIIDRAFSAKNPLKPNFRFNFIIALAAGLLTGITLAFLIEHLDRTVKSPEEAVSEFGLPLFARIPKFKGSEISDAGEKGLSPMMISYFEPKNVAAEQFKMLMINTKFSFDGINERNTAIMVNSSEPGEGKTLVCGNLGATYAMAGYRTIIIDADFHRPAQHKLFGIDNFHGLTDIMLGEKKDKLIKATSIENLYILPSGAIPPSPAMFFESELFNNLVTELKQDYDIVLIDSAPTSNISDSLLIVPKADNLLFVVSLRQTTKPIINKTIKDIKNIFNKPVGMVCNNVGLKNISGQYYRY